MRMLFRKGCVLITATLFLMLNIASVSAQDHTAFNTPDEAVAALITALGTNDVAALGVLLGPDSEDILSSGDDVDDANARADFLERYQAQHALIEEDENTMLLQVGDNDWPFPVPIVKDEGKWYLDGAEGADEVVFRRIGRNELGAIAVCRGFVDAQIEYAEAGHDGDGPGLYAAKLRSDPDEHNGLFWPSEDGEPESPIGAAVAQAAAEGYRAVIGKRNAYHGYYYRMLYAQGADADGGVEEYFVDGQLIGGIALIAWPADYANSGVMSFIVNQEGIVYQKDLGEDTSAVVEGIQVYNPDDTWSVVESEDDS